MAEVAEVFELYSTGGKGKDVWHVEPNLSFFASASVSGRPARNVVSAADAQLVVRAAGFNPNGAQLASLGGGEQVMSLESHNVVLSSSPIQSGFDFDLLRIRCLCEHIRRIWPQSRRSSGLCRTKMHRQSWYRLL
eukprot:SAG11_NODE_4990_length_1701_cov_1.780899_2_plen_135_part_00